MIYKPKPNTRIPPNPHTPYVRFFCFIYWWYINNYVILVFIPAHYVRSEQATVARINLSIKPTAVFFCFFVVFIAIKATEGEQIEGKIIVAVQFLAAQCKQYSSIIVWSTGTTHSIIPTIYHSTFQVCGFTAFRLFEWFRIPYSLICS